MAKRTLKRHAIVFSSRGGFLELGETVLQMIDPAAELFDLPFELGAGEGFRFESGRGS